MIAEYRSKTNIGVGLGIVAQIAGRVLMHAGGSGAPIGAVLGVAGAVLFIWGCWNYAVGKGHSGWRGPAGPV